MRPPLLRAATSATCGHLCYVRPPLPYAATSATCDVIAGAVAGHAERDHHRRAIGGVQRGLPQELDAGVRVYVRVCVVSRDAASSAGEAGGSAYWSCERSCQPLCVVVF